MTSPKWPVLLESGTFRGHGVVSPGSLEICSRVAI